MPSREAEVVSRVLKAAWIVVLIADLGVLAYGLMALATPEILADGYRAFTGEDWSALRSTSPRSVDYILLLGRLVGAMNVAFAAVALAVVWAGFRKGAPWSWYTLLVGNTLGYAGPIAADLTTGAIGIFEQAEFALLGAVYVALAVSAKDVLVRQG